MEGRASTFEEPKNESSTQYSHLWLLDLRPELILLISLLFITDALHDLLNQIHVCQILLLHRLLLKNLVLKHLQILK